VYGFAKTHNMSFRSKILILTFLLLLISLAAVEGVVYYNGKKALEKNTGTHLQYLAEEAVEEANSYVFEVYREFEKWSQSELLQDLTGEDSGRKIREFLLKKQQKLPSLIDANVVDVSGNIIASLSGDFKQTNLSRKKSFQHAITGRPHISDIHLDKQRGKWVMDFAVPIESRLGQEKFHGVLAVRREMGNILEGFTAYFSEHHSDMAKGRSFVPTVLLLRKDGLVIGESISEEGRLFQHNVFEQGIFPQQLFDQGLGGYFIKKDFKGKDFLVGYSFDDFGQDFFKANWDGFALQDTRQVFLPVIWMRNIIIQLGIFIILGAVFAVMLISKNMTQPVWRMVTAANQVAQGDLDTHIDHVAKDEFGVLAETFNKMIGDLKKQKTELLNRESYVSSVFGATEESIVVVDEKGVIKEFNRAAEETFGYLAEEAVGRNINDLVPSLYREGHDGNPFGEAQEDKAEDTGKGYREMEGLRKNGNKLLLNITMRGVLLPATNRKIFVGIMRDISQHKTIEEKVELLARFPDENPQPTMRFSKDGVMLYANKAALPLLHAWDCKVGDVVRDYWHSIISEVLINKRRKEMEVTWDDRIYSLSFVPLADFGYVNIYGFDVTDQKKANSELRESEARISSIVKAAIDGIITVNDGGIVQLFNPAASKIFGYEPEEVVGKSIRMLMPTTLDRSQYDKYLANYVKAGEKKVVGSRQEVYGQRKDENVIPLDLSLSEVIMPNGQRIFIGIVRDITERKQAEAEVKKAMAAKDDFTSMVSHELRTPLAISKEALSLILRKKAGEVTAQQEEIITMASANIDRLGYLINDILDATKVSAGKMALSKETLNIINLVRENFEGWKLKAETKNIELTLTAAEEVLTMPIDRVRFMQILSNLVSNAIKFTPEFGKIEIIVEEMADMVKFLVRDSGVGISEEDIPKIFQKFQQLERKYGPGKQGTGLGLNISKSLVELHGGQMFVDSKVGKGTTFAFTIPKTPK